MALALTVPVRDRPNSRLGVTWLYDTAIGVSGLLPAVVAVVVAVLALVAVGRAERREPSLAAPAGNGWLQRLRDRLPLPTWSEPLPEQAPDAALVRRLRLLRRLVAVLVVLVVAPSAHELVGPLPRPSR